MDDYPHIPIWPIVLDCLWRDRTWLGRILLLLFFPSWVIGLMLIIVIDGTETPLFQKLFTNKKK